MLAFTVRVLDIWKQGFSAVVDWTLLASLPRRPIGPFTSPLAVWQYLEARYVYTGDPWDGRIDLVLNPYKLQGMLEKGKEYAKRLPVDCDDVAAWAFKALKTIPGCTAQMFAIYDPYPSKWAHCICVYELNGKFGAIDTNGHRELANLQSATILNEWDRIYKVTYTVINEVHIPF
jgi:hypothetical protein